MSTINNRDFNVGAKLFLALTIFLLAKSIFAYITQYDIAQMLDLAARQSQLITLIGFNVLMIGAACAVYAKKRWGLIALLLLALVKMFVTNSSGANASYAFCLGANIAVFIREMGLFLIAMCFRKNGISGWVALLASEKYIDKRMRDKSKTHIDVQDETAHNIVVEHVEGVGEEPENNDITIEVATEGDSLITEEIAENPIINNIIHEGSNKSRAKYFKLIVLSICMFLFGAVITYLIFRESPNCNIQSDISCGDCEAGTNDILDSVYENVLFDEHDGYYLCHYGDGYLLRNYYSFHENKAKVLGKEIYAIIDTVHIYNDIDIQSKYAYFTQIKSLEFIITLDGYEGESERDINWWRSHEKRLYQKHPQAKVYASSNQGNWSIIQGSELCSLYDEIIAKEPESIIVKIEKRNFSIQRTYFNGLELGKSINKSVIANFLNVNSSSIKYIRRPIGTSYIIEKPTDFSGITWSAIDVRCIEDKMSTIIMKHSANESNYEIYSSLRRLLKDKYGDPINEYEGLLWQDGETAIRLSYDVIKQTTNGTTYNVNLEYSDIGLINQGQKTIIHEL